MEVDGQDMLLIERWTDESSVEVFGSAIEGQREDGDFCEEGGVILYFWLSSCGRV